MSLDATVFTRGFRLLCERFGRDKPSDELVRVYFEEVRELTDEQFRAACRTVFREDTYFPAPVRLLDLAGVGAQAQAREAWQLVMDAIRAGKPPRLTGDAAAAYHAIGGYPAVAHCHEVHDLPHVRRRFLEAYSDARNRTDRNDKRLAAPNMLQLGRNE